MRILIGCEKSGVVRRAFTALGHDTWSADLKPSDDGSNHHYTGDVRDILREGWDALLVCHPPCTRLCNSGVRWLNVAPVKLNPENYAPDECADYATMTERQKLAFMWDSLRKGAAFFSELWNADIPRIAVENPVMHGHAQKLIDNFRPAAQTVQPWWFGDAAFKATGWYLRALPQLTATNVLPRPERGSDAYKRWSAVHYCAPGPKRSEIRSQFFPGMADAMAMQWGNVIARQPNLI